MYVVVDGVDVDSNAIKRLEDHKIVEENEDWKSELLHSVICESNFHNWFIFKVS